jgi:tRNA pseudouridine38-40 synthase
MSSPVELEPEVGSQPGRRFKLTLAYRGTRYRGWQKQAVPPTWKGPVVEEQGLPTVQETIERCLLEVVRHPLHLAGSSRTDAGVHARGQVAHFDCHRLSLPAEGLRRAVNARLPGDIVVRRIEPVEPSFDAIRWTTSKRYEYLIRNSPERDAFNADSSFWRWHRLDLDRMSRASRRIIGTHDFAAFARPGHGRESTVRTIFDAGVERRGEMVVFFVEGSGFLWNQVRIMAGTLIDVGIGKKSIDDVSMIIESKDRTRAGDTAPAHGLYLDWIRFRCDHEALDLRPLVGPSRDPLPGPPEGCDAEMPARSSSVLPSEASS